MNWTGVGFTPDGGSLTTFDSIDRVSISTGGQLLTYKGDGSVFPTIAVNHDNRPGVQVSSSNPAQFMGLAPGTAGTWAGTHKDAKGAALGGIDYALVGSVESNDTEGAHAAWGTATLSILGVSVDGTTNPLSFTRV
jgi:hypothetical protein